LSQRCEKFPRGYVRFEGGKFGYHRGVIINSSLPYIFSDSFENRMVYRTWLAKKEIIKTVGLLIQEDFSTICDLVYELLPKDFLPPMFRSIESFFNYLNFLSIRQLEDLNALLRVGR
jgi:hypothetical protein